MDINGILIKLGLTSPEDKIYLSILKLHRSSIAQISEDTGIYRPTIYKTLPSLIEKNLISKTKVGKRTMYIAEDPTTLENLFETIKSEFDEVIPELNRLYDGNQNKPLVKYFEGKKSIKHIYDDMIRASKRGDSTYRYESPKDYKLIGKYYPQSYWKRATGEAGEIEKFVITNEDTQKRRRVRLNRHSKAIPSSYDAFDYNITQLIYKNKVAFIDFDTETATVIESRRFADFQLRLFKLLFGKL